MTILYQQSKEQDLASLHIDLSQIEDKAGLFDTSSCEDVTRYSLTFKSSYVTGSSRNDTVYSEVFMNQNRKAPLLILLHGLGSRKSSLHNYYCLIEHVLKSGLNCIFFNLPFHLNRTPDGETSGERNLYFDDIDTLHFYHQAVVDIRRLLDITTGIFEFQKNAICGISLGSMIAAITLAVDKRLSRGILVLSGGNWHQIHWNSTLHYLLKGNCLKNEGDVINKEKCRDIYQGYPDFLIEFKKLANPETIDLQLSSMESLRNKTLKKCFLCDPLTYAHLIDPEKIIMLNSRFDHFFNRKSTELLWNELGKPEIYWFNSPHTSRLICRRRARKIITDFIYNNKKPG